MSVSSPSSSGNRELCEQGARPKTKQKDWNPQWNQKLSSQGADKRPTAAEGQPHLGRPRGSGDSDDLYREFHEAMRHGRGRFPLSRGASETSLPRNIAHKSSHQDGLSASSGSSLHLEAGRDQHHHHQPGISMFFRWFRRRPRERDASPQTRSAQASPVTRRGAPVNAVGSLDRLGYTSSASTASVNEVLSTASSFTFLHSPRNEGPSSEKVKRKLSSDVQVQPREGGSVTLRRKYGLHRGESTSTLRTDAATLAQNNAAAIRALRTEWESQMKEVESRSQVSDNKLKRVSTTGSGRGSFPGRKKRPAPPPPSGPHKHNSNPTLSEAMTVGGACAVLPGDSRVTKHFSFIHVPGKRKAPSPPSLQRSGRSRSVTTESSAVARLNIPPPHYGGSLSPSSTLSRKKKAPSPPKESKWNDLNSNLDDAKYNYLGYNDEKVHDPLNSRTILSKFQLYQKSPLSPAIAVQTDTSDASGVTPVPLNDELIYDTSCPRNDILKLEGGILRPISEKAQLQSAPKANGTFPDSARKTLPLRPWYKRHAAHSPRRGDHATPLNEKRKWKAGVDLEEWMPDVSYYRRSVYVNSLAVPAAQHSSSLGTPSTSTSKSRNASASSEDRTMPKTDSKRRSLLMNISELDREAAEIIQKEKERQLERKLAEDARYYVDVDPNKNTIFHKTTDLATTDAQLPRPPGANDDDEEDSPKKASTKELIQMFNALNTTRVTLNSSYLSNERPDHDQTAAASQIAGGARALPQPADTPPEIDSVPTVMTDLAKFIDKTRQDLNSPRLSKRPIKEQTSLKSPSQQCPAILPNSPAAKSGKDLKPSSPPRQQNPAGKDNKSLQTTNVLDFRLPESKGKVGDLKNMEDRKENIVKEYAPKPEQKSFRDIRHPTQPELRLPESKQKSESLKAADICDENLDKAVVTKPEQLSAKEVNDSLKITANGVQPFVTCTAPTPTLFPGGARPKTTNSFQVNPTGETKSSLVEDGDSWSCSTCTLMNKSTRLWCEACSALRPRKCLPPSFRKENQTEKPIVVQDVARSDLFKKTPESQGLVESSKAARVDPVSTKKEETKLTPFVNGNIQSTTKWEEEIKKYFGEKPTVSSKNSAVDIAAPAARHAALQTNATPSQNLAIQDTSTDLSSIASKEKTNEQMVSKPGSAHTKPEVAMPSTFIGSKPDRKTSQCQSGQPETTSNPSEENARLDAEALRKARLAFFTSQLGMTNKTPTEKDKDTVTEECKQTTPKNSTPGAEQPNCKAKSHKVSSGCQTSIETLRKTTPIVKRHPTELSTTDGKEQAAGVEKIQAEGKKPESPYEPMKNQDFAKIETALAAENRTNQSNISNSSFQLSQYLQQRDQIPATSAKKKDQSPSKSTQEESRVSTLLMRLEEAIAHGQFDKAAVLAKELAAIKRPTSSAEVTPKNTLKVSKSEHDPVSKQSLPPKLTKSLSVEPASKPIPIDPATKPAIPRDPQPTGEGGSRKVSRAGTSIDLPLTSEAKLLPEAASPKKERELTNQIAPTESKTHMKEPIAVDPATKPGIPRDSQPTGEEVSRKVSRAGTSIELPMTSEAKLLPEAARPKKERELTNQIPLTESKIFTKDPIPVAEVKEKLAADDGTSQLTVTPATAENNVKMQTVHEIDTPGAMPADQDADRKVEKTAAAPTGVKSPVKKSTAQTQTKISQIAPQVSTKTPATPKKMPEVQPKPDDSLLVDIYIEDRLSQRGPFPLPLTPETTLKQLKLLVQREHLVPAEMQRWILGKKLASDDHVSLLQYGVTANHTPLYLYLVAPEAAELKTQPKKTEEAIHVPETVAERQPKRYFNYEDDRYSTCDESDSDHSVHEELKPVDPPKEPTEMAAAMIATVVQVKQTITRGQQPQNGWICPTCTLLNPDTRPGCEACATARSAAGTAGAQEEQPQQQPDSAASASYTALLTLENSDIVPNGDSFDCPVCMMTVPPGVGATLRDCLHTFCKDCLAHVVEFSTEATVHCPYRDNNYACESTLQDREIKALVKGDVYEKHLERSMKLAEKQMKNAFHCQTPNCAGWCIIEDNVNIFRCPVCRHSNCLTCQAIHEGINCKEYQDRVTEDAESNEDAKRTKEMIDALVQSGEALACPQCQVVLMKRWGCDWVRCSVCRTEICWVTRGRRWGEKGKGDISGGCRCGVNGVKCHPQCNYCH